ncbi:MAG: cell division protein FtsQ [Methylobacter sp.]|nr:MAG: cell division protein FtsQ [Methylobacter sp.]PPD17713.1 MAG: cell division protein FtsQ [Methylobacter sp.]PPD35218.1 MAG: cell division protein FtsQ [Methylomonas sp.]
MKLDKSAAGALLMVAVIGLGWRYQAQLKTVDAGVAPIRHVKTGGDFENISPEEIEQTVSPWVVSGFFTADMQAIHNALAELPWVEQVAVKRVWPDTVQITIKEKKAYVRWGQTGLLTEQGELFVPKNVDQFQALPMVIGPESQHKKLLGIMNGIAATLSAKSLALAEFKANDRWSWAIKLNTGMEIKLGRNEPLKKLDRFLATLPLLGRLVDAIAIADLRYTNGYAVSWKPEAGEIDWNKLVNPNTESNGHIKNPA